MGEVGGVEVVFGEAVGDGLQAFFKGVKGEDVGEEEVADGDVSDD